MPLEGKQVRLMDTLMSWGRGCGGIGRFHGPDHSFADQTPEVSSHRQNQDI